MGDALESSDAEGNVNNGQSIPPLSNRSVSGSSSTTTSRNQKRASSNVSLATSRRKATPEAPMIAQNAVMDMIMIHQEEDNLRQRQREEDKARWRQEQRERDQRREQEQRERDQRREDREERAREDDRRMFQSLLMLQFGIGANTGGDRPNGTTNNNNDTNNNDTNSNNSSK